MYEPVGPEEAHLKREVIGTARVRRTGGLTFPVHEVVGPTGEILARLGRFGWLSAYFGRGQRIELPDGGRWRLGSTVVGGAICPVIRASGGGWIALGHAGPGYYTVTGRDFGYVLYPGERTGFSRADTWMLREHETEFAVIQLSGMWIDAARPVHIGAAVLAVAMARDGVLGENRLIMPRVQWVRS